MITKIQRLLGACLLSLAAVSSHAQAWPSKSVKLVVPGAPGSSPDRVARLLAEHLGKQWGVAVIVENRPGATTRIGAEFVAKAPPDGTTLLFTVNAHSMIPAIYPESKLDPVADFMPIAKVIEPEVVFVVRSDSPYRTLKDLVNGVKQRKTPLPFAHFGNGSPFHLYGLLLGQSANIEVLPVAFRGEAPQMNDLLGGQIESSFNSVGTALPYIRAGSIRPLAVLSSTRSKLLPDVPTFVESGFPRIVDHSWFGLLAPAHSPKPIVDQIARDVSALIVDPGIAQSLRDQGLAPAPLGPDAFTQKIRSEVQEWKSLMSEFKMIGTF